MTSDASAWMAIGWSLSSLPKNAVKDPSDGDKVFDLCFPHGDYFDGQDKIFGYEFLKTPDWEFKETSTNEINKAWDDMTDWLIKNVEESGYFTDEFIQFLVNNKPKLYIGVYYG